MKGKEKREKKGIATKRIGEEGRKNGGRGGD